MSYIMIQQIINVVIVLNEMKRKENVAIISTYFM